MHNFEILKHASLRKANSLQLIEKWTLEMEYQCSLDRTPIWRESCRAGCPVGAQKQHHLYCLTVHWEFLIIPSVSGKRECNITKEQSGAGCKKGCLPQPFMDAQKLQQRISRRDFIHLLVYKIYMYIQVLSYYV